jgi:hypothetical protein
MKHSFFLSRLFQVLASQLLKGVKAEEIRPDTHPGKMAPRARTAPPVKLPPALVIQAGMSIEELHARFKASPSSKNLSRVEKKRSLSGL